MVNRLAGGEVLQLERLPDLDLAFFEWDPSRRLDRFGFDFTWIIRRIEGLSRSVQRL